MTNVKIFEDMIGQIYSEVYINITSIAVGGDLYDSIIFKNKNGNGFKFEHIQKCCEDVRIEDVCGNLSDLTNSEILQAECVTKISDNNSDKSETWTFYKFATIKGSVTIRWYGTSNGYYSEEVTRSSL